MTRAASLLAALCAFFVLCFGTPSAAADTPPAQIAASLQQSSVYVDTSIEDASAIQSRIHSRLNSDDGLKIAILDDSTQASVSSTARAIAKLLPSEGTVVVASGAKGAAVAASEWPSQVDADDMMSRVMSVVQNSTDLTLRYVQSVHDWQSLHPKPVPLVPPTPPVDHSQAISLSLGGMAVVLAGAAIGFVIVRRNKQFREINGASRRNRATLRKILIYRDQFKNERIASDLTNICKDAVYFFRDTGKEDALILDHQLRNVLPVLETYAKIKKERDYYDDPDGLLQSGAESVHDLKEFVHAVARKGNRQEIGQYEVNTQIIRDAKNSTTF